MSRKVTRSEIKSSADLKNLIGLKVKCSVKSNWRRAVPYD